METLARQPPRDKDFLLQTLSIFDHPSTSFWRTLEAKEISAELSRTGMSRPILDLGCGDGRFVKLAFGTASLDVGLDLIPRALAKARRSGCYSYLVAGDGSRLPFRDKAFRMIFSNSVLEHIPNLTPVLREVGRVLKDEGLIVFSVPSANFPKFLLPSLLQKIRVFGPFIEWYAQKRNFLLRHFHLYDSDRWKNLLADEGFLSLRDRCCLPRSAVQIWDAMALGTYAARAILRFLPTFSGHIVNRSRRLRVAILCAVLLRFYRGSTVDGGDLIIVAQKVGTRGM